jgi:hypothetical protein
MEKWKGKNTVKREREREREEGRERDEKKVVFLR